MPRRQKGNGVWKLTLRDEKTSRVIEIRARTLVNAAGPWANDVFTNASTARRPRPSVW